MAREHPRHSGDRSKASNIVRIRDDEPHAAGSGGGAALPMGGVATSTALQLAPAPHPSQATRDEQHRIVGASRHHRGKSPMRHSQDAPGRRAHLDAGGSGVRPRDHDRAPSNLVRSQSASRSTWLSPPPTPAEALARVQLLLDFPLLRRSSTSGEPPFEALSTSPTKMSHSRRAPPVGVLSSRCVPAVGGSGMPRP